MRRTGAAPKERHSPAFRVIVRQFAAAPGRRGNLLPVLDLVAAAGLWLATPWGGVIWLLGAFTQFFAAFALPGFFSYLRLPPILP